MKAKKKTKRRPWYEKHHEECNAFRAKFGATEGEGLKRLAQMKASSNLHTRELAATLERTARQAFWSADFLDAYVGSMPSILTMKEPK